MNFRVQLLLLTTTLLFAPSLSAVKAGHPDFSGVWVGIPLEGEKGFGLRAFMAVIPKELPFTESAKKEVEEYKGLVGPEAESPGKFCLTDGMPTSMLFAGVDPFGTYPMEIVQGRDAFVFIYESHTDVRHVYFGKQIKPVSDRVPSRNGYSEAKWEGKVLVINTSSLKHQVDQFVPHSENAMIEERYYLEEHKSGPRILVVDWTLRDPDFYTKPVTGQKKWRLDPTAIILPYECNEEAWLDHVETLKKAAAQKKQ